MNKLARFWGERSGVEKALIGTAVAAAAVATGGAAVYAIAAHGVVIKTAAGTTIAAGVAARELVKRV